MSVPQEQHGFQCNLAYLMQVINSAVFPTSLLSGSQLRTLASVAVPLSSLHVRPRLGQHDGPNCELQHLVVIYLRHLIQRQSPTIVKRVDTAHYRYSILFPPQSGKTSRYPSAVRAIDGNTNSPLSLFSSCSTKTTQNNGLETLICNGHACMWHNATSYMYLIARLQSRCILIEAKR